MKKTIGEYRSSMDKITPSGSFISETEALMKKVRDEQSAQKNNTVPVQSETMQLVDLFSKEARNRRIKKTAAAFSAAAAVLIAAVSLNFYNKVNIPNVDTSVTERTVSQSAEETAEEAPSEATEPEITVTTVTALPEEEDLPEVQEFFDDEPPQDVYTGDVDLAEEGPNVSTESAQTEVSGQKKPDNGHNEVRTANHISDGGTGTEPLTAPEGDDITDLDGDSSQNETAPALDSYSVSEGINEDEVTDTEYNGIPVYVPGFGGIGYEEDDEESEEAVESPYNYENVTPEVYSLRFGYDIETQNIEAADKVYVPDSIFSLDSGEYYLVITPGFDDYDPINGTAYAPAEVKVNENDTENIELIMSRMLNAASDSDASYYDSEQRLSDYRYEIAVYSADESEDNAMLFDISFNSDCLVINRYDNGTVSSVEYALSSDEYDDSNKAVEQLYE